MNRIIVLGCSGSGKSTLVRALAKQTGIPAFHLDQMYWQPGWTPHPDLSVFRETVDRVVSGERWILDGGFYDAAGPLRFARADCIVIFDLPTRICLYRVLKRWWTFRGETRPDLAPGCPETFDPAFLWYIMTYRSRQTPKGDALIAQHFKGRIVRIRSEAERVAFMRLG